VGISKKHPSVHLSISLYYYHGGELPNRKIRENMDLENGKGGKIERKKEMNE
jgi:hypothetical protein